MVRPPPPPSGKKGRTRFDLGRVGRVRKFSDACFQMLAKKG